MLLLKSVSYSFKNFTKGMLMSSFICHIFAITIKTLKEKKIKDIKYNITGTLDRQSNTRICACIELVDMIRLKHGKKQAVIPFHLKALRYSEIKPPKSDNCSSTR